MDRLVSDSISDCLERTASVAEPVGRPSRREADSGSRRRPLPNAENEAEPEEDSEGPPHKIDSLA
jgi:hypothetical protein